MNFSLSFRHQTTEKHSDQDKIENIADFCHVTQLGHILFKTCACLSNQMCQEGGLTSLGDWLIIFHCQMIYSKGKIEVNEAHDLF